MGIDTGDARRRSKCAPGCQVAILIGLGDAARSVVNASLRRAKGRARERRIRERLGPESQSIYGGGRALARLGRHRQRWHCRGTHRRRALASRCAGPRQRRRKIHSPDEAMKRCISWCVSPPLECPLLASRAFPLCQTLCRFCDDFFAFLSFRSRSLGSFRLGFYDLVHTDLSFLGLTYTGSQLSTSSRSLPPCTT
jgi:hypothetical protein